MTIIVIVVVDVVIVIIIVIVIVIIIIIMTIIIVIITYDVIIIMFIIVTLRCRCCQTLFICRSRLEQRTIPWYPVLSPIEYSHPCQVSMCICASGKRLMVRRGLLSLRVLRRTCYAIIPCGIPTNTML